MNRTRATIACVTDAAAVALSGCTETEDGDLSAPYNVSCASGTCLLTLSWDWEGQEDSGTVAGTVQFRIERKSADGSWVFVQAMDVDPDGGSFSWVNAAPADNTLVVGAAYSYRVKVVDSDSDRVSPWSNTALAIMRGSVAGPQVGGIGMGCGDI